MEPRLPWAPIAPAWHTAALVALIVTVALVGTLMSFGHSRPSPAPEGPRLVAVYVPVLVMQIGLAVYVCRIGRASSALAILVGRGWATLRRACGDLALAAAAFATIEASEAWFARFGTSRNASALSLLPHVAVDRVAWVLVALVVGVCEEIVYRGYLLRQLAAFTGRTTLAIAMQGLLFGIAHADQGLVVALRLGVYGCALGALARWRGSLIPGMAAHAGIDLVAGLLA